MGVDDHSVSDAHFPARMVVTANGVFGPEDPSIAGSIAASHRAIQTANDDAEDAEVGEAANDSRPGKVGNASGIGQTGEVDQFVHASMSAADWSH